MFLRNIKQCTYTIENLKRSELCHSDSISDIGALRINNILEGELQLFWQGSPNLRSKLKVQLKKKHV